MAGSHSYSHRARAANLNALQTEIARQLRGRLDLPWALPRVLGDLLDALQESQTPAPS